MMIDVSELVILLRSIQKRLGHARLAVIRVPVGSSSFDWNSLPAQVECPLPGIDVGQCEDWRFPTDGYEKLHAQLFRPRGVVEFHLDSVNACRNVASHIVADTQVLHGAVKGGVLGLLAGLAGGRPRTAALLGASAGALIGSQIPRRPRKVYALDKLLAAIAIRLRQRHPNMLRACE